MGQQRITIAGALYHQPEILVFDEATSSLDSLSEQYIQETIRELRNKNKTIIIIAHRLSTVVHADEIMLLENGQITESGTHKELFSLNGKYHQLWQQHFWVLPQFNALLLLGFDLKLRFRFLVVYSGCA